MEVNSNQNIDAAHRVIINRASSKGMPRESDTTSFERVAALDRALRETPLVRPEVVARAKELISDVKYPSNAAIEGIAALLALKLETGFES
jgi:hypothetical protein